MSAKEPNDGLCTGCLRHKPPGLKELCCKHYRETTIVNGWLWYVPFYERLSWAVCQLGINHKGPCGPDNEFIFDKET